MIVSELIEMLREMDEEAMVALVVTSPQDRNSDLLVEITAVERADRMDTRWSASDGGWRLDDERPDDDGAPEDSPASFVLLT